MQLNKVALGLSLGFLCGATILCLTILAMILGGGAHLILLNKYYIGYSISLPGAILGLVYGFIDGFIGGWLIAFLYNRFAPSA